MKSRTLHCIRQTHDKSVDEMSYKSGQATHKWNHLFGLAFQEKGGALCEFLRSKSTKD